MEDFKELVKYNSQIAEKELEILNSYQLPKSQEKKLSVVKQLVTYQKMYGIITKTPKQIKSDILKYQRISVSERTISDILSSINEYFGENTKITTLENVDMLETTVKQAGLSKLKVKLGTMLRSFQQGFVEGIIQSNLFEKKNTGDNSYITKLKEENIKLKEEIKRLERLLILENKLN